MGHLRPANHFVPQSLQQPMDAAIQDRVLSPAEKQYLRTEAEASGEIDNQEAAFLQEISSITHVPLPQGKAQTVIEGAALFDTLPPPSLSGQFVGQDERGTPVFLGASLGTGIATEKEALQQAYDRGSFVDQPDTAVVQNAQGYYELYDLERTREGAFKDSHDFNGYSRLRAAQWQDPNIEAPAQPEARLIAVVSEDKQVRYLGRESSPAAYQRPPDPEPLLPPTAASLQRQAVVTTLRAHAGQVLDRLQHMEQDLGQQQDHRGVFAAMYRVITERGIAELDGYIARGDWRAAEFEGALLVNFANRYFDAYDAYASGNLEQVPEVWRSAFDGGRNAEAKGYPKASITEVVGASMIAHIINDLPQTLQDIGYAQAPDRDTALTAVYDSFNGPLMDEKDRIMDAVSHHYGKTDMHFLDGLAGQLLTPYLAGPGLSHTPQSGLLSVWGSQANQKLQGEVFTLMRTVARQRAVEMEPAEIRQKAQGISDAARFLTPGGN